MTLYRGLTQPYSMRKKPDSSQQGEYWTPSLPDQAWAGFTNGFESFEPQEWAYLLKATLPLDRKLYKMRKNESSYAKGKEFQNELIKQGYDGFVGVMEGTSIKEYCFFKPLIPEQFSVIRNEFENEDFDIGNMFNFRKLSQACRKLKWSQTPIKKQKSLYEPIKYERPQKSERELKLDKFIQSNSTPWYEYAWDDATKYNSLPEQIKKKFDNIFMDYNNKKYSIKEKYDFAKSVGMTDVEFIQLTGRKSQEMQDQAIKLLNVDIDSLLKNVLLESKLFKYVSSKYGSE